MLKNVRELVAKEIREHFQPPKGQSRYPGGQRAIAEALHVSQPTLNRSLMHDKAGLDLDTLIGLRAYFAEQERPKTIDDLLGLPPLGRSGGMTDEQIAAITARVSEELESKIEAKLEEYDSRQHGSRIRPARSK